MSDGSGGAAGRADVRSRGRLTRRRLISGALGGGALATGAATVGVARGRRESPTAPSPQLDKRILGFFLTLEQVQQTFYGAAVESGQLSGELLHYAAAVREQEAHHAAFLADRLGHHAASAPPVHLDHALIAPGRFGVAAVELEEAVLGGYIGQAASLTGDAMRAAVTLVSVEGRQAAWIRDLTGVSPAPRAADSARSTDAVLQFLRDRGYAR